MEGVHTAGAVIDNGQFGMVTIKQGEIKDSGSPFKEMTDKERQVWQDLVDHAYDQFLAVKKSCNENTGGLTYQKFSEKLVKNRDDLMSKTGCKDVRFTVYVKDGKAALKATPVKDE